MSKKFKHLNLSPYWQQYFSKYPQGYTIIENLIDWVSQVDDMVDSQNTLTERVNKFDTDLDNFIEQFDGRLSGEVIGTLEEWQRTGFLDIVIDSALETKFHTMDDRLTQNIVDLDEQVTGIAVDPTDHGVVGNGSHDDTDGFNEAFNHGDYILAPQGKRYRIFGKIEIPAGKTLDLNGSTIQFSHSDAHFDVSPDAQFRNARIEISGDIYQNKAVIYLDGNKNFMLGTNERTVIENIRALKSGGEHRYQGEFIHFDATQRSIHAPCYISGVTINNVSSFRFEYGIRHTVKGIRDSEYTSYITGNMVHNYTAYNPLNFVWEDDLEGTSTQLSDNLYTDLQCQADSTEKVFIRLVGRLSRFTNFIAWDFHRITNQTDQFLIYGNYNHIEGNIPSYDSPLIKNTGIQNTIIAKNTGITSDYLNMVVSERPMRTMLDGSSKVVPFEITTSNVPLVSTTDMTHLFDLDIPKSAISTGYATIDLNAFGSAKAPSDRYYGIYANGNTIASGRLRGVGTIAWKLDVNFVIRYYGDSARVTGIIESSDGQLYTGETTFNLDSNDNLRFEVRFQTEVAGDMTCLGRHAQMTRA